MRFFGSSKSLSLNLTLLTFIFGLSLQASPPKFDFVFGEFSGNSVSLRIGRADGRYVSLQELGEQKEALFNQMKNQPLWVVGIHPFTVTKVKFTASLHIPNQNQTWGYVYWFSGKHDTILELRPPSLTPSETKRINDYINAELDAKFGPNSKGAELIPMEVVGEFRFKGIDGPVLLVSGWKEKSVALKQFSASGVFGLKKDGGKWISQFEDISYERVPLYHSFVPPLLHPDGSVSLITTTQAYTLTYFTIFEQQDSAFVKKFTSSLFRYQP